MLDVSCTGPWQPHPAQPIGAGSVPMARLPGASTGAGSEIPTTNHFCSLGKPREEERKVTSERYCSEMFM